jgi:zinc D-Ala-D-Ala carboxypeptidase
MKYFTIEELTITSTGLPNRPNEAESRALFTLVDKILDPAREWLKSPVNVNSGYRSKKVNKAVGGSAKSQHLKGQAADITSKDNARLFAIIREMDFDQLIWEKGTDESPEWIHVSYVSKEKNRKQVLRFKNGKYELF